MLIDGRFANPRPATTVPRHWAIRRPFAKTPLIPWFFLKFSGLPREGCEIMGQSLLGVLAITVLLFLAVAATGYVVFGTGDE